MYDSDNRMYNYNKIAYKETRSDTYRLERLIAYSQYDDENYHNYNTPKDDRLGRRDRLRRRKVVRNKYSCSAGELDDSHDSYIHRSRRVAVDPKRIAAMQKNIPMCTKKNLLKLTEALKDQAYACDWPSYTLDM